MFLKDGHCCRCAKRLDPTTAVMLELNFRTGLWAEGGTVPEDESQGGFDFGPDCAKAIV
jgi:hypothetical protein